MTDVAEHLQDAKREVDKAVQKAAPFIEKMARFGMVAKGFVYVLVGVLAAMAAIGTGGATVGAPGAMKTVWGKPYGVVLLFGIGAGLSAYALWLFVRAVRDPENEKAKNYGPIRRVALFWRAIVQAGLAVIAFKLMFGFANVGSNEGVDEWTRIVMAYPAGRIITALIGAGFIAYGVRQLYAGYISKLDKKLRLRPLSDHAKKLVTTIARFGIASRGIVFGIIGMFLAVAAWKNNPTEARGIGGALHALIEQPYGPALLVVVAIGLAAYGIYLFVLARYRQITPA
jgi:hypothetical protein